MKNLNNNYSVDVLPGDCTANTLSTMILNICDTIVHVLEHKLLIEVYAFHVSNILYTLEAINILQQFTAVYEIYNNLL